MAFVDKFQLRIPGPTPIPPRIQQAMNKPITGHRSQEASILIQQTTEKLKPIFGTNYPPILLAGSGTLGLETAVINLLSPNDEALVVVTGAFGNRFAQIVQTYGFTLHRLDIEWGKACDPDTLSRFMKQYPKVKAVFLTYCETSTGVLNPIKELSEVIHQHSDALVIVDGVSAIGAVPFEMDHWGIDVAVTGSQKALMLPPGLAIIALSERAQRQIQSKLQPRFYLDLRRYQNSLTQNTTPFTPALTLIYGLDEALNMLNEEGLEQVYQRHMQLKAMTRAGLKALGFHLMTSEENASPTVTSVWGDASRNAESIRQELRKQKIILAGGQQQLKGKIFRIGHMGYCDQWDIITVIAALEQSLYALNIPVEWGSGVKAAQEVLAHV